MNHWEGCPADEPRIDAFGAYCGVCGASNTRTQGATMSGADSRCSDVSAPSRSNLSERSPQMIRHCTPGVNAPAKTVE